MAKRRHYGTAKLLGVKWYWWAGGAFVNNYVMTFVPSLQFRRFELPPGGPQS